MGSDQENAQKLHKVLIEIQEVFHRLVSADSPLSEDERHAINVAMDPLQEEINMLLQQDSIEDLEDEYLDELFSMVEELKSLEKKNPEQEESSSTNNKLNHKQSDTNNVKSAVHKQSTSNVKHRQYFQ